MSPKSQFSKAIFMILTLTLSLTKLIAAPSDTPIDEQSNTTMVERIGKDSHPAAFETPESVTQTAENEWEQFANKTSIEHLNRFIAKYSKRTIHLGKNQYSVTPRIVETAISLKNAQIAIQSEDLKLIEYKGYRLWKSGYPELAVEVMEKAISLGGDRYFDLALAYSDAKQYRKAIALWDKLEKKTPDNAWIWNNRATCYAELGNTKAAFLDVNRAIILDPEVSTYYRNRGWYFADLEQYSMATKDMLKAYELNPKRSDTLLELIELLIIAGQLDQAEQASRAYSKSIDNRDAIIMIVLIVALREAQGFKSHEAYNIFVNLLKTEYPNGFDFRLYWNFDGIRDWAKNQNPHLKVAVESAINMAEQHQLPLRRYDLIKLE